MNEITKDKLRMLEAKAHGTATKAAATHGRLRVYYGWSKINKIQKREAIAVAFENKELAGDEDRRSGKSLRKTMTICYERFQTEAEMSDAPFCNRVFTVYNVFMDDKKIGGSLEKALFYNANADENHVSKKERDIIADKLRSAYKTSHPDYFEHTPQQLEIKFDV